MTATRHARRGRIASIAALFRFDASRPPAPRATIGLRAADVPAPKVAAEDHGERDDATVATPAPGGPVHMAADETGTFPCCGQHETQVPGWQADDPRLVTCRTAAHDTMPDDRAAMNRPFAPENKPRPEVPAYVPDLFADICELPGLRAAIRWRAQCLHAGCDCEPRTTAAESAEWLASQYADLRPDEDSWWAAGPAQDEAMAAGMRVAA